VLAMTPKNSVRLLALASAFALSLSACGSDDGGGNGGASDSGLDLVKAGTLTVCSDVPYPPFEDFDKGSELGFKGFDVDIVKSIAEEMDLKLQIRDSSFDTLQSGLAPSSGQCDMAASAMTITDERKQNLDFSDGYYDSKQSLLVPSGSDISSIDDLGGKKVGVQQGTTGKSYAEENAKGAQLVTFPSDAEMYSAIKAGQVDALLQDLPVNLDHTKDGKFEIVETYDTDEEYGFAIKKGNSELVDEVNKALTELRDSGDYQKIYDQYFATK
jgi:polar amino acid transport system substrate-binding protein